MKLQTRLRLARPVEPLRGLLQILDGLVALEELAQPVQDLAVAIISGVYFRLGLLVIVDLRRLFEPGNDLCHLLFTEPRQRAGDFVQQPFLGALVELVIIQHAQHGAGPANDMVGVGANVFLFVALLQEVAGTGVAKCVEIAECDPEQAREAAPRQIRKMSHGSPSGSDGRSCHGILHHGCKARRPQQPFAPGQGGVVRNSTP